MRDLEPTHENVGQTGIEIDLNEDGHRQQKDGEPALGKVLSLKRENQYQRQQ